MVVGEPRVDGATVSAPVFLPDRETDIFYSASPGPISQLADPFLVATLIPAMRFGLDLVMRAPVSSRLMAAIPRVQKILHGWNRRFRRIDVQADLRPGSRDADRGTASFFSCGVDSFFSVLRHDDIDKLVFARGFDPKIAGTARDEQLNRHVRTAASELGKPLIEVETNIRTVWDREVSWEYFHGAAVLSIALALAPRFSRIYMPPSHDLASLVPWGSHPDLDPLWSTEEVEILYVDAEPTRFQRVAVLADSDVALRHLQVCWEHRNEEYNCCRCEKCLRLMTTLHVLGKLDASPAFPLPLEPNAIASLTLYPLHIRKQAAENLRALEAAGGNDDLSQAIRQALRRPLAGRLRRFLSRRRHAAPL